MERSHSSAPGGSTWYSPSSVSSPKLLDHIRPKSSSKVCTTNGFFFSCQRRKNSDWHTLHFGVFCGERRETRLTTSMSIVTILSSSNPHFCLIEDDVARAFLLDPILFPGKRTIPLSDYKFNCTITTHPLSNLNSIPTLASLQTLDYNSFCTNPSWNA